MAFLLSCLALVLSFSFLEAEPREPHVEIYSRHPAEKGKPNILNCYVDGFHPPTINITLQRNGQPIEGMKRSDLSFGSDWAFNLLVYGDITPDNSEYTCVVEHSTLPKPRIVKWDQAY